MAFPLIENTPFGKSLLLKKFLFLKILLLNEYFFLLRFYFNEPVEQVRGVFYWLIYHRAKFQTSLNCKCMQMINSVLYNESFVCKGVNEFWKKRENHDFTVFSPFPTMFSQHAHSDH